MTDWDARYRENEIPWEKGRPAPAIAEVLARWPQLWNGGARIMVPGCGYGHDVRELAAHGYRAVGVDLSPLAVARAREFPKAGGELYEEADFLNPEWGREGEFTGWWEHTCFCAIPRNLRQRYAEVAARLIRPGGIMAGVFFLTPNDPGEEDEGPPFNATILEIDGYFSPWFERLDGWVPSTAYPGREGREWVGVFRRSEVGFFTEPQVAESAGVP